MLLEEEEVVFLMIEGWPLPRLPWCTDVLFLVLAVPDLDEALLELYEVVDCDELYSNFCYYN